MGENSAIEWTTHTFNPWWGCTKVSPACANCYAKGLAKRFSPGLWGPDSRRRFFGAEHWNEPPCWNRRAKREGVRRRVFCGSMCDVLEQLPDRHPDRSTMAAERYKLRKLIEATPHLDWLLLTKRPEMLLHIFGWSWISAQSNVWAGTTVENQATADERIPHLLQVPARVRFLSMEPLLGPVNLSVALSCESCGYTQRDQHHPKYGHGDHALCDHGVDDPGPTTVHWVIAGGESGPGARPMDPDWARSIRDQCQAAGVPFFFKQWGAWIPGCQLTREAAATSAVVAGGARRVGKKIAGRVIDGRTWDEVPA